MRNNEDRGHTACRGTLLLTGGREGCGPWQNVILCVVTVITFQTIQ